MFALITEIISLISLNQKQNKIKENLRISTFYNYSILIKQLILKKRYF